MAVFVGVIVLRSALAAATIGAAAAAAAAPFAALAAGLFSKQRKIAAERGGHTWLLEHKRDANEYRSTNVNEHSDF